MSVWLNAYVRYSENCTAAVITLNLAFVAAAAMHVQMIVP